MNQTQFKFDFIVDGSFQDPLQIKFSGSENEGTYDLYRPSNKGERHKWKGLALKSSDWKMLCNTIFLARLNELPEEEPECELYILDSSYFTLSIETNGTRFSRTRCVNPESRFCVVVNKMIDLIPQLDEPVTPKVNLKDYYKL